MAAPQCIPADSVEPHILYSLPIYVITLIVSLVFFSILPIASYFGYIWEWTLWIAIYAFLLCKIIAVVGGIIMLFRNWLWAILCFSIAWIAHYANDWLIPQHEYFATCSLWFYDLMWEYYEEYSVGFYSWTPLMLVVSCGCVAWLTLFSAQILNFLPRIIYGRVHCPHANCDYVGGITLRCPHCETLISNLAPSRYGVFTALCPSCELRLRTGWQWGKKEYHKHCTECMEDWDLLGLGISITRRLILAGAPNSGKTSFLIKSIAEMQQFYPTHIQYTTTDQQLFIQEVASELSLDYPCETTFPEERPEAVPVLFNTSPRKMLAYFYDSAGGEFDPETTHYLFYQNSDGIFLFLDPFAEPKILEYLNISSDYFPDGFEAARKTADVVAGDLCGILEKITGKDSSSVFHIPLCVVLTKTEMFDLYKVIDSTGFSLSRWEAHSQKVVQFLKDCGLYNFLGILESRFSHTMFFASSAYLQIPPADRKHSSCLAPALWMMRQIEGF